MKNKIIKLSILILLGFVVPINSYSQVNMERFIEIKCNVGANFSLDLAGTSTNTNVLIKMGYYQVSKTIQMVLFDTPTIYLVAYDTIVRIYGEVKTMMFRGDTYNSIRDMNIDSNTCLTQIWTNGISLPNVHFNNAPNLKVLRLMDCRIESIDVSNIENLLYLDVCHNEDLKKLDLRGLKKLQVLYFEKTGVSDININGLNALNEIYCYNTNLSTMGLDSLFCALPERSDSLPGMIVVIQDTVYSDVSTYMASNSQNLISKNWFPTDRNYKLMPPSYGTFDCSSIGIDDIEVDIVEAKVYPNPTNNNLTVETTKESIQMLEVYDALGRRVLSKTPKQKSINLDVSNLERGMYILKIQTEKGIGTYKVIKD